MENEENRKTFQELPAAENPQFLADGKRIYSSMRSLYPNDTVVDLDNILSGMCVALACFMWENVDKSDHKEFLQLIWQILNKNIS
jgi:hypothetical protein